MEFSAIYGEVELAIKQPKGSRQQLAKNSCNMVYLNEILSADDLRTLFWLRSLVDSYNSKAPATITGITAATPGVFTAVAHGFVEDDIVTIYNVAGMTEVNNRTFKVAAATLAANTFTVKLIDGAAASGLDTSGFTAYTSGGSVVHRGITLETNIELIIDNPEWHDEAIMTEIDDKELVKNSSLYWDDSTQRPQRWQHRKQFVENEEVNELWWFPGSDAAYDLRFWAEKQVSELSADDDVPELPERLQRAIVSGAITRLAESNVQVENAIVWPSLYKMALDAVRAYNQKYYNQNALERRKTAHML